MRPQVSNSIHVQMPWIARPWQQPETGVMFEPVDGLGTWSYRAGFPPCSILRVLRLHKNIPHPATAARGQSGSTAKHGQETFRELLCEPLAHGKHLAPNSRRRGIALP